MYPTVLDGDWVFVDPSAGVRPAQIAVFDRNGTTIVHRVVSVRRGLEMGDACWHANHFLPGQVVGRVIALTRDGETVDLTGSRREIRDQLRWIRSVGRLGCRKLGRITSSVMLTASRGLRTTQKQGRP